MELIPHERLKRMSAMISGAIAFYETDGDDILKILRQLKARSDHRHGNNRRFPLLAQAPDGSLRQRG